MERHCIHLYYGDGKGKTTAAIGLAIRACGNGMRVGILSFLKDGNSSENRILDTIPGIERFPCLPAVKFSFQMTSDEQTKAAAYYHALLKRAEARHDLDFFLLDEVLDVCQAGLLPEEALLHFLHQQKNRAEIVLTGHIPSERLLAAADYITEMHSHRHPYREGLAARRGIEW